MSSTWNLIIVSKLTGPPPIVVEVWAHQVNARTRRLNLELVVDMDWHSKVGGMWRRGKLGAPSAYTFPFCILIPFIAIFDPRKKKRNLITKKTRKIPVAPSINETFVVAGSALHKLLHPNLSMTSSRHGHPPGPSLFLSYSPHGNESPMCFGRP